MRPMIAWILLTLLSFAVLSSASAYGQTERERAAMKGELTEKELKAPRSMRDELTDLGLRFDCWFTIERTSTPTSRTLARARFEIGAEVKSREALLGALKRQLQGAVIEVDPAHPQVFHVIENSLAEDPDYAMDKPATMKFSGVLADLPEKIGDVVPGIDMRRGGGNSDAFNDHSTRAELEATNKPVRDILTHAVPIEKYEPVLWIAETFEREGKQVTWVQFTGPYDRKNEERE